MEEQLHAQLEALMQDASFIEQLEAAKGSAVQIKNLFGDKGIEISETEAAGIGGILLMPENSDAEMDESSLDAVAGGATAIHMVYALLRHWFRRKRGSDRLLFGGVGDRTR